VESFIGQQEALSSPAAMTARVLVDAKRTFGEVADVDVLERCVEHAVADLWQVTIKVKTFVPVLAMRRIRDMLERGEGTVAESDGRADAD
jgi:hypothetical protein